MTTTLRTGLVIGLLLWSAGCDARSKADESGGADSGGPTSSDPLIPAEGPLAFDLQGAEDFGGRQAVTLTGVLRGPHRVVLGGWFEGTQRGDSPLVLGGSTDAPAELPDPGYDAAAGAGRRTYFQAAYAADTGALLWVYRSEGSFPTVSPRSFIARDLVVTPESCGFRAWALGDGLPDTAAGWPSDVSLISGAPDQWFIAQRCGEGQDFTRLLDGAFNVTIEAEEPGGWQGGDVADGGFVVAGAHQADVVLGGQVIPGTGRDAALLASIGDDGATRWFWRSQAAALADSHLVDVEHVAGMTVACGVAEDEEVWGVGAFDAEGARRWGALDAEGGGCGAIAAVAEQAIVAADQGGLQVYDPETGEVRAAWSLAVGWTSQLSVYADAGAMYWSSPSEDSGQVYAWRLQAAE